MSRLFGPMRQVGIVVRDIDKAMRHWVEVCGVGPWFYAEQLPMTEFRYKGKPYDIKVSIALANSGDVQLELIQQRCDSPSLYRDFLAGGHEGMQHGQAGRSTITRSASGPCTAAGKSARKASRHAVPSSISSTRAIPGLLWKLPRRPQPACASSTRSAKPPSTGTEATRSG